MIYVCGFAFNGPHVALILKNRPAHLAGKLNGIGGKLEEGDSSPEAAMAREFLEEAGVATTADEWVKVGEFLVNHDAIYFYKMDMDDERFSNIGQQTDEETYILDVDDAFELNNQCDFQLDTDASQFLLAAVKGQFISISMDRVFHE